ncbi:hypothetical protein BJ508DRAFT_351434 [Ascobolus immersus RN42]|uniref:Uncharacterized protein n=1 Tax=Ascobolus immersus RN42 TaxID=1160509 RepID=A0A3N4HS63_ASCIM|nr:hypothetical protein BJ508DRAFT_351434 [Ascobolus immersus RN42]
MKSSVFFPPFVLLFNIKPAYQFPITADHDTSTIHSVLEGYPATSRITSLFTPESTTATNGILDSSFLNAPFSNHFIDHETDNTIVHSTLSDVLLPFPRIDKEHAFDPFNPHSYDRPGMDFLEDEIFHLPKLPHLPETFADLETMSSSFGGDGNSDSRCSGIAGPSCPKRLYPFVSNKENRDPSLPIWILPQEPFRAGDSRSICPFPNPLGFEVEINPAYEADGNFGVEELKVALRKHDIFGEDDVEELEEMCRRQPAYRVCTRRWSAFKFAKRDVDVGTAPDLTEAMEVWGLEGKDSDAEAGQQVEENVEHQGEEKVEDWTEIEIEEQLVYHRFVRDGLSALLRALENPSTKPIVAEEGAYVPDIQQEMHTWHTFYFYHEMHYFKEGGCLYMPEQDICRFDYWVESEKDVEGDAWKGIREKVESTLQPGSFWKGDLDRFPLTGEWEVFAPLLEDMKRRGMREIYHVHPWPEAGAVEKRSLGEDGGSVGKGHGQKKQEAGDDNVDSQSASSGSSEEVSPEKQWPRARTVSKQGSQELAVERTEVEGDDTAARWYNIHPGAVHLDHYSDYTHGRDYGNREPPLISDPTSKFRAHKLEAEQEAERIRKLMEDQDGSVEKADSEHQTQVTTEKDHDEESKKSSTKKNTHGAYKADNAGMESSEKGQEVHMDTKHYAHGHYSLHPHEL